MERKGVEGITGKQCDIRDTEERDRGRVARNNKEMDNKARLT